MKKFVCVFLVLCAFLIFPGCSEADKVNANISKQADYFECERRITVYNARTDKIILECECAEAFKNFKQYLPIEIEAEGVDGGKAEQN